MNAAEVYANLIDAVEAQHARFHEGELRDADQLTDSERSAIMGGTLEKIYRWSPEIAQRTNG